MTLLTQPPENVKISFINRVSDAPIHFPSFKVATGNHSVFGVDTSKMPCLQELSAIGSHSSHVTTGILFIWEKFKTVLPDPEYFLYMFMCVREIVATVVTVATCTIPSIDGSPLLLMYMRICGRDYCEISCFRRMPILNPLINPCRSCSQHRSFTVSMIVFTRSTGRPCSRRFRFSLYCRTA